MGHEHDRGARLGADAQELGLHALARHLVERAERLVHEQQPRLLGERARDRDALLHAAGELVGVVRREVGESDELEQLGDRARAQRTPTPCSLERQLDVRRDGAPRQQARLLEGDAVLLVDPRLLRGLAEHADVARGRRVEVGDQAQQRRLAAPDGPMSETNSPAATVRSIAVERRDRRAAWLRGTPCRRR